MRVDVAGIQAGARRGVPRSRWFREKRRFRWYEGYEKKPGPEDGPGKCWLVARIKLEALMRRERKRKPRAEILSVSEGSWPNQNPSAKRRETLKRETLETWMLGASSRSYCQVPHLG
jgi:hypothetical protein